MNNTEMILIDLTTKTIIKGPINKDQIDKKKIRNRIDKAGIKTYNQIIKIKKTIRIGHGCRSKYSLKEK